MAYEILRFPIDGTIDADGHATRTRIIPEAGWRRCSASSSPSRSRPGRRCWGRTWGGSTSST